MSSEIVSRFKLVLPAGEVRPGQALSSIAPFINVHNFASDFNNLTKKFEKGQQLRVGVNIYPDSRKFKIM
jgi:ribosomal protein L11